MAAVYSTQPKLHRSNVTAVDASDPVDTSGAVDTKGYRECRFDVTLTGTGFQSLEVQVLFWNPRQGLWWGGDKRVFNTIGRHALVVDSRGAIVFLKVTAFSGTSFNLSSDYALSWEGKMLKLAGEGITRERIESILYNPGLKTTNDLESGTHTIVPTSRPAIGSAQYSAQLTLPKPDDARMAVKRIAARLSVNIAGLGTATHVYLSVRVDVDDAGHELFSEDWTSAGSKLSAVDTHSGSKATIFNLLKDGSAHTFYFLLWADVGNQATVDLVQLWEGVGSSELGGGSSCLEIFHTGWLSVADNTGRQGTGTVSQCIFSGVGAIGQRLRTITTSLELAMADNTALSYDKVILSIFGTVTTDLNYLDVIRVLLRSEL